MNLTTFLLKPKLFLTDSLFYAMITPIIAYFLSFLARLFLTSFYLAFNNTKKYRIIFQMRYFLKIQGNN